MAGRSGPSVGAAASRPPKATVGTQHLEQSGIQDRGGLLAQVEAIRSDRRDRVHHLHVGHIRLLVQHVPAGPGHRLGSWELLGIGPDDVSDAEQLAVVGRHDIEPVLGR